jgi:hypothetical protein
MLVMLANGKGRSAPPRVFGGSQNSGGVKSAGVPYHSGAVLSLEFAEIFDRALGTGYKPSQKTQ